MVKATTTKSAEAQQSNYNGQKKVTFTVGQTMFLDNPTRGKLDWSMEHHQYQRTSHIRITDGIHKAHSTCEPNETNVNW